MIEGINKSAKGKYIYSSEGAHAIKYENGQIKVFLDGSSKGSAKVGSGLKDGQWHHFGVTSDGTTTTVYIDGTSVDTNAESLHDLSGLTRPTTLGSQWDGSKEFTGDLDDIRVYDRVLTAQEVADLAAMGGAPPANQAPSVLAGADQSIISPEDMVNLDGTVSDDGLPAASVTTNWTVVSGPGTVTFGDASAIDTTATFSAEGVYVLRLTADDGELTSSDDVTVTLSAAPSVTVSNPSFENPVLASNGWTAAIPDWTRNTNNAYLEGGGWFATPHGNNDVKLWDGNGVWQQVGTWAPGQSYDLTVWAGRQHSGSALRVSIWAGGDPNLDNPGGDAAISAVGATMIQQVILTPTVAVGQGEDLNASFQSGNGHTTGDPLWILIESDNGITYLDNVRLTDTP